MNSNIVLFTEDIDPFEFGIQLTASEVNGSNSVILSEISFLSDFLFNPNNQRVILSQPSNSSLPTISSSIDGSSNITLPSETNLSLFRSSGFLNSINYLYFIENDSLFSTPINQSGPTIRLSPDIPPTSEVEVAQLIESTQKIIFSIFDSITDSESIYIVPIDGSSPAILLTELPENTFIRSNSINTFVINEDSSQAFFASRPFDEPSSEGDSIQIFSVDLGSDLDFEILVTNNNIVYVFSDGENDFTQLFSNNTDGSQSPILLDSGLEINGLSLFNGANSSYALYEKESDNNSEIFSAIIDGSSNPIPLRADGVDLSQRFFASSSFAVSERENLVFFASSQLSNNFNRQLFTAPADGSTPAVLINSTDNTRNIQFGINEQSIFYTSQPLNSDITQLIQSNLDGSKVSILDQSLSSINYQLSNDGNYIVYPRRTDLIENGLFSIKLDNQEKPLCFPIKNKTGDISIICL